MKNTDGSIFYTRHLPHFQPNDATYSVVMRLAGSLPLQAVIELQQERDVWLGSTTGEKKQRVERHRELRVRMFKKLDGLLNHPKSGPMWLTNPVVAEIVAGAMKYWDNRAYELLAYSIMSNHVHIVFSTGEASTVPLPDFPLRGPTRYPVTNVLVSIKKYTAIRSNRVLRQSGQFWQDESYDHVVREKELERTIWYVLNNPVKAGLVNKWEEWPWSYLKEGVV